MRLRAIYQVIVPTKPINVGDLVILSTGHSHTYDCFVHWKTYKSFQNLHTNELNKIIQESTLESYSRLKFVCLWSWYVSLWCHNFNIDSHLKQRKKDNVALKWKLICIKTTLKKDSLMFVLKDDFNLFPKFWAKISLVL